LSEEDNYLKEGWNVYIDEPYNGYYRILRREPFDFVTGEESPAIFSTVASGNQSGFKNIDTLEPDNDPLHLFQVFWGVADVGDIKYYLKIPTGQNRFGVDKNKEIGFLNADKSPFYEPNPTFQFFLVHDHVPSVNCVNGSPAVITPKIWFRGMKYDIQKLGEANMQNPPGIVKKIVFGGIKNTP
jgi:hypothetical protein